MGSLPILRERALDANGDPIPGAKLYFYSAGTVTAKATYADDDLTTANTNPMVADGDGWFGEIYMLTDAAYKIKYTDAADVTIWTVDNVNSGALGGSSLAARITQIASNPLDQGAVGDGAADESTEVQAAITAATGTVDLLGKTYRCDSRIVMKSNVKLKNGTLDFTNCPDSSYILAQGTIGTPTLLDANAAAGSSTVSVASSTGFSTGDLVHLYSSGFWSGSSGNQVGELGEVVSTTGTSITLKSKFESAYNTADSASIVVISSVKNFQLEDLDILCDGAAAGTGDAIFIDYGQNIEIKDVRVNGPKASAVALRTCDRVLVERLSCFDSVANGVKIQDCSRNVRVIRSEFDTCAGAAVICGDQSARKGVSRNIDVADCDMTDCDYGVYCYDGCQYVLVDDITCRGITTAGNYGVAAFCGDIRIMDCEFYDLDLNAILLDPDAINTEIKYIEAIGNRALGCTPSTAAIEYDGVTGNNLIKLTIDNNFVDAPTTVFGIRAEWFATDYVSIKNNTIESVDSLCIQALAQETTSVCDISGNVMKGGGNGLALTGTASTIAKLKMSANDITTTGHAALVSNGGTKTLISGCSFVATGTDKAALQLTTASDAESIVISGCLMESDIDSDSTVLLAGYSVNTVVSGCIVNALGASAGTTGAGIEFAGSAANAYDVILVTGSIIQAQGCEFAVIASNDVKSHIDGCSAAFVTLVHDGFSTVSDVETI